MKKQTLLLILLASVIYANGRTWTNQKGQTFEGKLLSYDSKYASIERGEDRRKFQIERSILSEDDQLYISKLEATKKFYDGVLTDFMEASELSRLEDKPAYVFYRNKLPLEEFHNLVSEYLIKNEFLEKIEGRCILTVIDKKDEELERRIASWIAKYDHSPMVIFQGRSDYSTYNFGSRHSSGMSFEVFLGKVEEQLTHFEDIQEARTSR